jgi:hypothetical protein
MFLYTHIIIEYLCLLFAFLYLKNTKDWWILFIPYMICVVITETLGIYIMLHQTKSGDNYWVHNYYLPVYFAFSLYALYRICTPLFRVEKWITAMAVIIAISYLAESYRSGFKKLSVDSFSLANAIFVVFCCSYYYHLLKQDNFINIKKHAPFWVITGMLFFCFGSTVSYLFFDTLVQINIKYNLPVRQVIFIVLNFILYGCWSYAFLCKYRQKT